MEEANNDRSPPTQCLVNDDEHVQNGGCHENDDADDSKVPKSSGDVQVSIIIHSFLTNIFNVSCYIILSIKQCLFG